MKSEAEKHLLEILNMKVPYEINIRDCHFIVSNTKVYPPGKLTEMFAEYFIENNLTKGKIVADIGAGCFALGIIAAKNGAKEVVGVDFNIDAVRSACENILYNNVQKNAAIYCGINLDPLINEYKGKIDLLLSGIPWDSISESEFLQIPDDRKTISRAIYDIDDALITDILLRGKTLLSPNGKIFITASERIIERIDSLCSTHNAKYKIVKAADLHKDANLHYIVELYPNGNSAISNH